jgi:mono/diheme cytochrome c family protein
MVGRVIFGTAVVVGTVMLAVYPLVGSEKPGTVSATADQVTRGEYLVKLGGCGDCHSPKNMTAHGPVEDSSRLLSGHPANEPVPAPPTDLSPQGWIAACNGHMTAWVGPWGVSYAVNLTSDKKTGLGNWTDEQFIQAMRTGKHRGFGRPILPPMPWFNLAQASDEDLSAILAYLKTTKPVVNQAPEPIPPISK